MKMKEHLVLTVSGIVFAGGAVLVGGAANATTATNHENVTAAPHGVTYGESSTTNLSSHRPRCRYYVRGHWVHGRRHGRGHWVPGHWMPRGCSHR